MRRRSGDRTARLSVNQRRSDGPLDAPCDCGHTPSSGFLTDRNPDKSGSRTHSLEVTHVQHKTRRSRPSQERWPWPWAWPRAAPPRGGTDSSSGPIKIGVVVPLTGPFAPLGIGDKAAIEQEVEADQRRRRRPGPRPRGDHQGRQDRCPAVGDRVQPAGRGPRATPPSSPPPTSAASTAIGPSAESNKIPTIALGPVSAFKDGSNDYAFTCVAIPELYAEAMVDYLEAEGIESLAIALHVGGPLRQERQRRDRRGRRRGGHRRGG